MAGTVNSASNELGPVWADPSLQLEDILKTSPTMEEAFDLALSKGFFSQYTAYQNRDFAAQVVAWQHQSLVDGGTDIGDEPAEICESALCPDHLKVDLHGRTVSPDFLRVYSYVRDIRNVGLVHSDNPVILEIGSGYGNFARLTKLDYPKATLVLCDIEASLAFAAYYLRQSFPDARILDCENEDLPENIEGFDFVFVPLGKRHLLKGRRYDLAVNIWSFGEVQDAYLQEWFDLLQGEADVRAVYLLNAFLAPVTMSTVNRLGVGQWLPRLDDLWNIVGFCIDPPIHRCPWVTDYSNGALVMARRFGSEEERREAKDKAASAFAAVPLQDWASIALGSNGMDELLGKTAYVSRVQLGSGMDDTFFRLFDHYRLNKADEAATLIPIYLRYVLRNADADKATKEELFYAMRSNSDMIRDFYAPFSRSIARMNERGGDLKDPSAAQKAYDEAMESLEAGDVSAAETMLLEIVQTLPHAEAWHQLSIIAQTLYGESDASVLSRGLKALQLQPDHPPYRDFVIACLEKAWADHLDGDDQNLVGLLLGIGK